MSITGKPGNTNEGMNLNDDPRLKKGPADSMAIPFKELLGTPSLLSRNNSIVELKDIKKGLVEKIEGIRATATTEENRNSIPTFYDLNNTQSPNLPGIVLVCAISNEVYLMPVLFYKKGTAEHGEAYKGNNPVHRTAESYVNAKMRDRISSAFRRYNNTEMRVVKTLATYVVDVEQYEGDTPVIADNIAEAIMREWYNASLNFTIMAHARAATASSGVSLPSQFRDGSMFGSEGQAIARINALPQPYVLNGHPTPYNLCVTLCTGGRRQERDRGYSDHQETRTIASTFLNLSLEVRTPEDYRSAVSDPKLHSTRGPLVPVISLGHTVSGEQMMNNDSIVNVILGMYAQLVTNDPVNFCEAFRSGRPGVRGTLANLAKTAYEVSGIVPPENERLTVQTMGQQEIVEKFMRTYISPSPAFVIDLATYVDSPANNEWLWNMVMEPQVEVGEDKKPRRAKHTPYRDAYLMVLDSITDGGMSSYLTETANDPNAWKEHDPILVQTNTIIPVGTARHDGQLFSLECIDQQLLRSPVLYGDNQQAVAHLLNLYHSGSKDIRQRQQEIVNLLTYIFGPDVSVVGWRSRWTQLDKHLVALAHAMSRAGGINVQTWTGAEKWYSHTSNDYLNQTTSATVNTATQAGMMVGGVNNNWKNR